MPSKKSLRLYIKKSKIAGKGVFAGRAFKKGDRICLMNGTRMSLVEMFRRVDDGIEAPSDPLQIGAQTYLDLREIPRQFNHSCDPNAFLCGTNELKAMRDISAGEEITFDYSTTMNDNEKKIRASGNELWTCPCRCNTNRCRGIIDQFSTLHKKRQRFFVQNRYLQNFMLKAFAKQDSSNGSTKRLR